MDAAEVDCARWLSCHFPQGAGRENIRESTLEGLDTASRKGKHGNRPPLITDDMPHTVLRRRANGECRRGFSLPERWYSAKPASSPSSWISNRDFSVLSVTDRSMVPPRTAASDYG
ncbi:hypothetical protein [Kitasatospora sp. NPDC006786]|uniref:hypothetical protein n=1 Tax=unclassified Kitasatospora TaxID=2633591 RepID=UPI00340A62DD